MKRCVFCVTLTKIAENFRDLNEISSNVGKKLYRNILKNARFLNFPKKIVKRIWQAWGVIM